MHKMWFFFSCICLMKTLKKYVCAFLKVDQKLVEGLNLNSLWLQQDERPSSCGKYMQSFEYTFSKKMIHQGGQFNGP